jgi:hypothetical protein
MAKNYYVAGSWNVICDRCGFKFKSYELRKEWTGIMVCSCCYETRHPQDLIQQRSTERSLPWSRPEVADVFIRLPEFILTEDSSLIAEFRLLEESTIALTTEG